jgi:hypothetical protein
MPCWPMKAFTPGSASTRASSRCRTGKSAWGTCSLSSGCRSCSVAAAAAAPLGEVSLSVCSSLLKTAGEQRACRAAG